jgi:EmrB/QacA subfamily drug resistance transporter
MAVAIGPVTGGYLIEHFWWGSVFLVNVPVVIVAIVLGQLFVPTSKDPSAPPLDIPGALLSIAGLVALVWAIIEGPHGWTDPKVVVGFALAAVLLGTFVWWERRTPVPMLDMGFFKSRRFSAASGAIALTFFAMFGSLFLLTQYLQSVLGYTALEAGVRLVPMAAVQVVVAPLSAKVVERVGSKVIVGLGLGTAALGLVLAAQLEPDSTYGDVLVSLVVLAAGLALVMPTATESIMGSLPPAKAGVGSAVNDTTRELGGALGVAVLGSVMSSTYRPRVTEALAGTPVPDEVRGIVTDQVGAAIGVANQVGGEAGRALTAVAGSAFTDGMGTAFYIGAGALAVGAVIVALFLPARAPDHEGWQVLEGPAPDGPDASDGEPAVAAGTDGVPGTNGDGATPGGAGDQAGDDVRTPAERVGPSSPG